MKLSKRVVLGSLSLFGSLFLTQSSYAWIWRDTGYKICNKLGFSLQIKSDGGYQMHTNNAHSDDQIIEGNGCVNIDFASQWQSNGWDLDNALDFVLLSNGKEYGKFTVFVTSYLDGQTFSIRNYSDFVHEIYGAAAGGIFTGKGYIELK